MTKANIAQWDTTAANNEDINDISLAENVMKPPAVNNAFRETMAQIAQWTSEGTIASATTCDIGAQDEEFLNVTGTTTITGFGTVRAGTKRVLLFASALTLTHNATSLILPGGANIATAAGDIAVFVSEGSGNWRCTQYQRNKTVATFDSYIGGSRNKLINSLGMINQREYVSGTSTSGANEYTIDRWRVVTSGQSLSWTESEGVRTMTAPAGGVEQIVEGAGLLSGSYVLNWTGTATATVNGTSRTKGEVFTLTGGSNATVRFIGGTFSLPQLEQATSPTQFSFTDYALELSRCHRYFRRYSVVSIRGGLRSSGGSLFHGVMIFNTMRAAPSVSWASATAVASTWTNAQTTTVNADAIELAANCTAEGGTGRIDFVDVDLDAELT